MVGVISVIILLLCVVSLFLIRKGRQTVEGKLIQDIKQLQDIKVGVLREYPKWRHAIETLVIQIDNHSALLFFDVIDKEIGLIHLSGDFEVITQGSIRAVREVTEALEEDSRMIRKLAVHIDLAKGRTIEANFLAYPASYKSERIYRLGQEAANFYAIAQDVKG